jgi:leader peptidase (prepilin peptidase) / N-methyltransferase
MAPFEIILLAGAGPAGVLTARAAAHWPNWPAALHPAGLVRELCAGGALLLVATFAVLTLPPAWAAAGFVLALGLLFAGLVDSRTFLIPDLASYGLILAGLAFAYFVGGVDQAGAHAVAAILGFTAFWAIGAVFFAVRGIDGLGLGDAKLLAAAGAWCGLTPLAWIVLAAACATLLLARARQAPTPFGPGIAAATLAIWFSNAAGLGALT